jgi:hypothetical protein
MRCVALRVCGRKQPVRQCCRTRSQILPGAFGIKHAVIPHEKERPATEAAGLYSRVVSYAAFFPAFNFAQRARCAAAIFFLPAAEIVRFTSPKPVAFADPAPGCDAFRVFAHRAFCACAIFRREAADIVRVGWLALRDVPAPFKDSITVTA